VREMYEGDEYARKNPTWHEEDASWKANHVGRILTDNRVKFTTICEVGCGTGEILLNLEKQFPDASLSGYEIAPYAFNLAKQKETVKTKFYLDDISNLQPMDYDILLAIDVIEHVEEYISFIKCLKSIAKYKIFHIPLDLSVQSIVRSWPIMKLRADVGHLHYFYKDSALATLKSCGYKIISYRYTASRLELPNQARSSNIMRLPRRLMFSLHSDLAVRVLGGYSIMVLAE